MHILGVPFLNQNHSLSDITSSNAKKSSKIDVIETGSYFVVIVSVSYCEVVILLGNQQPANCYFGRNAVHLLLVAGQNFVW